MCQAGLPANLHQWSQWMAMSIHTGRCCFPMSPSPHSRVKSSSREAQNPRKPEKKPSYPPVPAPLAPSSLVGSRNDCACSFRQDSGLFRRLARRTRVLAYFSAVAGLHGGAPGCHTAGARTTFCCRGSLKTAPAALKTSSILRAKKIWG